MKFVEYFRNLDSKKQTLIAGALVITLAGGSMALKVHHEKVNPSTSPVSADEVDAKDKMISQQQLNAPKTKNKKSSNDVNLVPYNVDGSLGRLRSYNSTPLSLGGDYSYTPTVEPAVYEPIIEPVEDEPVIELDVPTEEPIVNEVVDEVDKPIIKPVVPNEATKPTAPNEEGVAEGIEEDNVLDIINSAAYKGKKITFFVEKYLQCEPTYDYLEEDGKQILTVNGNGLFIRFEKVGGGDYECTKITLNGQDRRDLLNTIFELNEGDSNNHVVIPPEPTIPGPTIPDPSLDKPVEEPTPEQPKDDKVEEDNVINPDNTGGTTPPPVVAPPAPTAPEEQEVVVG